MVLTLLNRLWRKPASGRAGQHTVQRWLVLQQGANPSTDYYIYPQLAATGLPILARDLDKDSPYPDDLAQGTGVVIVRYMNPAWMRALNARRGLLATVVYFMDDDLLQPAHWAGLPKTYIKKLNKYCRPFISDIQQLTAEYWFSTQALRDAYAFKNARIVSPRPMKDDLRTDDAQSPVRLFYHGSAAHAAEIDWLLPVVAEALDRCPHLQFEIIGNHDVNVRYRGLPRTRILHPMSWENYIRYCRTLDGHIGLAPLLKSPFNKSRSYTKVFDIARCRAAGIYTNSAPYDEMVSHGESGLLLANSPRLWTEAIVRVSQDAETLAKLRQGSQGLLQRAVSAPPGVGVGQVAG